VGIFPIYWEWTEAATNMAEPATTFTDLELRSALPPGPPDADWLPVAATMSVAEAIAEVLPLLPEPPSLAVLALGEPEHLRLAQRFHAAVAVLRLAARG
jgi:hypothetical protein